jgi:glutathione S-transferase
VTRDADAFAWIAAPKAGKLMHAGFKSTAVVAAPLVRLRYGINDDTAAEGREKTAAAFDRLESEIGPSGYLAGDAFSVADLTAAALFFPLVRPPESEHLTPDPLPEPLQQLQDRFVGRPGFEWVREMYRRHRGTSAAVTA